MVSMGVPVALIVAGIAVDGWGAISWTGAVVWGVVATVVLPSSARWARPVGMTDMDLLDLLGSAVAEPHTATT
jgi:hypothetical protein